MNWSRAACGLAVLIVAGWAVSGCSDRGNKKPERRKLEGVAVEIDLERNYVSMRTVNKRGVEVLLEGTFREDTVVEINGRSETLDHVRPGDKVEVYGYREGKGDEQKLVATKVIVTRPEEDDWKSTGRSAEEGEGAGSSAPEQSADSQETAPPDSGATEPEQE
jgi:hypothetical protein